MRNVLKKSIFAMFVAMLFSMILSVETNAKVVIPSDAPKHDGKAKVGEITEEVREVWYQFTTNNECVSYKFVFSLVDGEGARINIYNDAYQTAVEGFISDKTSNLNQAEIAAKLDRNTKYYICITPYWDGQKYAQYSLAYSTLFDYSDVKEEAELIEYGKTYTDEIVVSKDEDWFQIKTNNATTYNFELSQITEGISFSYVQMDICDASSKLVDNLETFKKGDTKKKDVTLEPNSTYYLKLFSPTSTSKLQYAITVKADESSAKPADNEAIKAFVGRLYSNVLGRDADEKGLQDWSKKLASREQTGSEVAAGFFMSQEMINRNLSDEDYVKTCYKTMLDRDADEGGLASWVSKLENGISREAVLYGFTNSIEFGNICKAAGIERGTLSSKQNRDQNEGITAFAARCYTKALGRKFDVDGLNDWSGQILNADNKKQKAEEVASNGFFHSEEFGNKNTSNEEYVEILYRTFLGREYDEKGKADWVGKLDSGVSRDEVLYGFSRSQEFSNIMATYGL